MILEVTANAGQKIGTLIDLASDTNYITHEAAGELNLRSEVVTLIVVVDVTLKIGEAAGKRLTRLVGFVAYTVGMFGAWCLH